MAGPGTGIRRLAVLHVSAVVVAFTAAAAGVLLACDDAGACVGARPLAMGGAFIAVADDSSAVYWNPAGLAWFVQRQVSLTSTLNNRDAFNYDEFLAYASHGPAPRWGAGLGFVAEHVGSLDGSGGYRASRWLVYSAGYSVLPDIALGANLRYEIHARRSPGSGLVLGSRWGMDLALLCRASPELSLGLLVQDAGLSPVRWGDGREETVRVNVRPGVAYRPDPATIIAVDLYDVGALASGAQEGTGCTFAVRAGVERRVWGHLTARLGYYGISPAVGAITCGAGWQGDTWQVDYVYLGAGTIPGHPGLGGTHQIGVTLKF
ncbi:MAG: hypothetical protein ACM3ZO_10835 [Clostridia bacterium]